MVYDILLSSHSLSQANNNISEIKNKIEFKVENIFTFGSPLGVFLALRGIRPANTGSREHILPKEVFKNYFNIFHPSDPIAYRLEPLILKEYSNKPSVIIHREDAGLKKPYSELNRNRSRKRLESKGELTEEVQLEEAIDFQVQNSMFRFMDHIRSHWGYWNSSDVAYFIMSQFVYNKVESQ